MPARRGRWHAAPMVVEMVQNRLTALEDWLDGRDHLEDRFTAGDLLMTTVLRMLRHTDIVATHRRCRRIRSAARRGPPSARRWRTTSGHTRRGAAELLFRHSN